MDEHRETAGGEGRPASLAGRVSPRAWRALVLLVGAALLFFRAPVVFLDPHFFAEEATVYFAFAWEHGVVESLLTPHLGYYSLLVNLATTVAARAVPLEAAPFVTLAASCSVLALLAALVMLRGSPFSAPGWQALAILLIVLVPPGYGRLHTTFSHFYLCLATALILISEPGGRGAAWVRRVGLVVAGLTGVLSVFLTPFFWWKWWRGRRREVLVQAALLSACMAVQASVYLTTDSGTELWHGTRFGAFDVALLPGVVLSQTLAHLLGGLPAMRAAGETLRAALETGEGASYWLWSLAAGLGCVTLFAAMLGPRAKEERGRAAYLLGAYVVVVALSVLAGTTGREPTRLAFLDDHQRYFFAPNVLVAFALLLQLVRGRGRWWRGGYGLLVAWVLIIGVLVYHHQTPEVFTRGPSWRAQVQRWRGNPERALHVWPARRWPPLRLAPR